MLSEVQNCKYEENILRVRWISTIHALSVVILAPVFAHLIQTLDWDQNSGVRLVFGLSKKLIQKVKSPTVNNKLSLWVTVRCKTAALYTIKYAPLTIRSGQSSSSMQLMVSEQQQATCGTQLMKGNSWKRNQT